jgi:predicted RNA-binding protein with RPS1 domain
MSLVSFTTYVERQGLSSGMASPVLEEIGRCTRAGEGCLALLDQLTQNSPFIIPAQVIKIRQAFRTYLALEEYAKELDWNEPLGTRLQVSAVRWALRTVTDETRRNLLLSAYMALVSSTLKHGSLRIQVRDLSNPNLGELSAFAGQSESCDEIPPHRFFTISRGVTDGLLWVEVLFPDGEAERIMGSLTNVPLAEELARVGSKAVLDTLAERAEREVIAMAAEVLYTLLARPPLSGAVAGIVCDERRLWAAVLNGEEVHSTEMGLHETVRLIDWLRPHAVQNAGVARVGGRGSYVELIQALGGAGVAVEPVREAGLMKQANALAKPIKLAAAEVVCRRLRDPLEGYAFLAADELGLGEYLDRVHAGRLLGALEDARQLVTWERMHGKLTAPRARGISVSPWVRSLADLRPGMEISGTVANLTHFGAFIEVGLPIQGLIHVSEIADRHVAHPGDAVKIGERVQARVLEVDVNRKRLSLTLRSSHTTSRQTSRRTVGTAKKALEELFKNDRQEGKK